VSPDASRIGKLILVPAVITLAVTLLRLVGESQGWSPILFDRGEEARSPSLVGIVWLVPVFGAWFGWKLTRAGSGPGSLGRALGADPAGRDRRDLRARPPPPGDSHPRSGGSLASPGGR
jgi:hypothetical protein